MGGGGGIRVRADRVSGSGWCLAAARLYGMLFPAPERENTGRE